MAVALGNERPTPIKEVEDKLWTQILRIATDEAKPADALTEFFEFVKRKEGSWDDTGASVKHWFQPGTGMFETIRCVNHNLT